MENTVSITGPGENIDIVNDSISLIQNSNYFKFGTDSLLLAGFIFGKSYKKAAELGCGSGILSLLTASRNKAEMIYSLEIQPYFADLAERNVKLNGLSDRINVLCQDIRTVSKDSNLCGCDMVFANPPYMKVDSGKRCSSVEKQGARHELFATLDDFISCASRIIKYGGDLYLVYRQDRLEDLFCSLRYHGFEAKILTFVHPDPSSPPSFVLVRSKASGSSGGIKVTRPFFIYNSVQSLDKREYSDDMIKLLESGSMEGFFPFLIH